MRSPRSSRLSASHEPQSAVSICRSGLAVGRPQSGGAANPLGDGPAVPPAPRPVNGENQASTVGLAEVGALSARRAIRARARRGR